MKRVLLASALVVALGGLMSSARASEAETQVQDKSAQAKAPLVVDLTLKGAIPEEPAPVGLDGTPLSDNLKALVETIARAKADDSVQGLVLRLRNPTLGWAKSHELRQAIQDFRASGKRAFAVLEVAENADYIVATAADEIVMPESGWLMLKGLAAEVTFYKKLFDTLGITADLMQVGEYKGAGEPFTRTEMSPAFREELTAILTDSYAMMAEAIAGRQGIALEEAQALIDGGPYTPEAAQAVGLINRIAYADELEVEIARGLGEDQIQLETEYGKKAEKIDFSGLAGFMRMLQMLSGESARKPASTQPKVAVIYASGLIQTGKSSRSLFGQSVLGSDTLIKNLKQAETDETVKAIVLRVDSPGGSALASDLIWRETVRIAKPIIASMSDVAASGGYYISMGCDRIFAEPGTITGSIGVVGGKIVLGGLMDKVGLTTETVTIGKNGTILSLVTPFSDDERAAMRKLMEQVYDQFVTKAADGRQMAVEDLEKLARGRIYTGRQAQQLGLVDELGTLDEAIVAAKERAGLKADDDVDLLVLPKPGGLLDALLGPLDGIDAHGPQIPLPVPEVLRGALVRIENLTRLIAREPVVLVMPFELRIR